jgi:poly[(R)-3-hydroxyalkanoate] polymerase subunit PhaC
VSHKNWFNIVRHIELMVLTLHGLQRIGVKGRRSTLETDSKDESSTENGDQHGGTAGIAPHTEPDVTKPVSAGKAAKKKSTSKRTQPTALQKEQRKAAAAQAAVEDLQQRLAAAQEALAEERQKAVVAQQALAEQRQAAVTSPEVSEPTAEQEQASEAAFGLMPFVGFRGMDLFNVSQQLAEQAIKQPPLVLKHYTDFLLEMGRVVTGQSPIEPNAKDKRFTDEVWKTNPYYHALLQTYLTWQQSLSAFIDDADLDKKDADRARFVLSLFADSVAPTNTLLGNPAAMKQMYETGGASLVKGLTHMIEDLADNGGLPSQVDMKAFQVGKDLGISPGSVVFKNEMLELIQYKPATQGVYRRPLLLVPPQVNKFYVLDLSPNKSIVRYLVDNGVQVFAISWRNPTPKQREWGFAAYDRGILEAIDAVRAITESPDVNIVGSCLGGMTLATLLGHLAALGDRRIDAVTFMVTVLDSSVESTLGLFATKETIAAAKEASRLRGVVEGQEMASMFAWLRPNDLIWNYWVNNYLIGKDPAAFDVLYWNNDTTRLPAKLHSDLLSLYETNAFAHPGSLEVLGTPIDLSKATNDAYIVAGITDHITPWQGCYATTQLLGGEVTFILSNSGHIQALLNPPGNPKASYFVNGRYPADPDQWQASAQKRAGSWWEDWRDWLGQRSGEKKAAPRELGSAQYQPGTPAPGTYVVEP